MIRHVLDWQVTTARQSAWIARRRLDLIRLRRQRACAITSSSACQNETNFCPLLVRPPTGRRTKMDEKTRRFTKKTHLLVSVENRPKPLNRLIILGKVWRRGPGSNRRIKVLQTSPLPLGYRALAGLPLFRDAFQICRSQPGRGRRAVWSGRRDLNSRPSPWQGDALPLSYSRFERLSS